MSCCEGSFGTSDGTELTSCWLWSWKGGSYQPFPGLTTRFASCILEEAQWLKNLAYSGSLCSKTILLDDKQWSMVGDVDKERAATVEKEATRRGTKNIRVATKNITNGIFPGILPSVINQLCAVVSVGPKWIKPVLSQLNLTSQRSSNVRLVTAVTRLLPKQSALPES